MKHVMTALFLLAATGAHASLEGTKNYVGAVIDRWSDREIRTVVTKIPASRDSAFDRSYDVYVVDTEKQTEERIAVDVTGSELQIAVKKTICPMSSNRAWDCGSGRYFPVADMMMDGGLPLVILGGAFDIATLPIRAPFVAVNSMKSNKMDRLTESLLNTSDELNKPPIYQKIYTTKVHSIRFNRLIRKIKNTMLEQE